MQHTRERTWQSHLNKDKDLRDAPLHQKKSFTTPLAQLQQDIEPLEAHQHWWVLRQKGLLLQAEALQLCTCGEDEAGDAALEHVRLGENDELGRELRQRQEQLLCRGGRDDWSR